MCLIFYIQILEVFTMKKLKMTAAKGLTFEEGCNRYMELKKVVQNVMQKIDKARER